MSVYIYIAIAGTYSYPYKSVYVYNIESARARKSMRHETTLRILPHTTISRILLSICLSSCGYICVLFRHETTLRMLPHTTIYISVLIRLHMCPDTRYLSAYSYTYVEQARTRRMREAIMLLQHLRARPAACIHPPARPLAAAHLLANVLQALEAL